jgi:hypothetical protein
MAYESVNPFEAALSVARRLDLAIESLITAVGKPLLFMQLRQ